MDDLRVVGGRYRLEEVIGRGAVKDVYRGRDLRTDERVAIARMVGCDRDVLEGEVALARKVESPHVARVRDAFVEQDVAYIVSELCTGPTLARRVEERPFTVDEALPVFLAMAAGLEAIHEARILHRDLKLNNVILRERDDEVSVAILDFGISAPSADEKTSVGPLPAAGTLGYMSRETIRGEPVDARSDVYALGVCFFEMLAGRPPLPPGDSALAWIEAFCDLDAHDLSPLPPLPEALRRLLARMLSMSIELRPYAPEVRAQLQRLLEDDRTEEARPTRAASAAARRAAFLKVAAIPHQGALHPDTVVLTGWAWAPLVTLRPGLETTTVEAFTAEGLRRWSSAVEGDLRRAVAADLDQDGVRELYVYGPSGVACLDARGRVLQRHARELSEDSTAFVVDDTAAPCVVVDGCPFARGRFLQPMQHLYEGDGRELVDARDGRGASFNGFASQAFRGAFRTPAAILQRRGSDVFCVAHLEASARRAATRIGLRVYGPGGGKVAEHEVAVSSFPTGDARAVQRFVGSEEKLFGERQAPIALEREGDFVVVVPLLGDVEPFAPVVAAYSVPDGRELWRMHLQGTAPGSAIFADAFGDGTAALLVGRQADEPLRVVDPGTGRLLAEADVAGAPLAFGDPFGSGSSHLFTLDDDEVAVWRGPPTLPGRVEWSGTRADRWRSGTRGRSGSPLGPP